MKRLCQYCRDPLGRFAKLFHIYTCKDCVSRMSMGGAPRIVRNLSPEEVEALREVPTKKWARFDE